MTKPISRVVTTYTISATKIIEPGSVAIGARFIPPSEQRIKAMASSLQAIGQLQPIMVHPVSRGTYRIVAGCTRLKAALALGWTKIRADIVVGSPEDYEIIQLVENAERSDLSAAQKKEARARVKELTRKKLEALMAMEPAKGGRGKKGGLAEAARQAGVPRSTAQDAMKKPAGDREFRQVSNPIEPAPIPQSLSSAALDICRARIAISFTIGERKRIDAYNEKKNNGTLPISDCVRVLVKDALKAEGF